MNRMLRPFALLLTTFAISVIAVAALVVGKASALPVEDKSNTPNIRLRSKKLSPQEIKDYVDFHNMVRREVGVGPVQWSDELAAYAQEWADYLAASGKMKHRTNNIYGENIAMHYETTITDGAKLWYTEKPLYRGDVLTKTNWKPAGHYTQMVWRNTRYVGAGRAVTANGRTMIVGNYDPPGNYMGQRPY